MEKIVLCGNANTGKSTVFNSLARANARVGNWLGVTCNVAEKILVFNGLPTVFADLPGLASASRAQSDDEEAALDYIKKNSSAKFLNICDINNLRRNMFLMLELIECGINLQIMFNFKKSFKGMFNMPLFEKLIGLKCIWFGEHLSFANFKKSQLSVPNDAQGKHRLIENILAQCYRRNAKYPHGYTYADKFLLNKFFALPIFLLVATAMFAITFLFFPFIFKVPIDAFVDMLAKISANSFYQQIIIGTLKTMLGFLPQVLAMLMCLNILENSGYISRLAFLCDDFFAKLGLSGKSVFPMLLSFGCASVAVDFVKTIKNQNSQIKTAAVLSLLPCGAKIPIMLAVFGSLLGEMAFFAVCATFFICIILALLFALILNKNAFKTSESETLLLEFPSFKMVRFGAAIKNTAISGVDFLKRVFGVVLVLNIILFLLQILNFNFGFFAPVFAPLGFNVPLAATALLFGLVAKELVLTSLFTAGATLTGIFSPPALMAFLIFALLYSPCAATIAAIKSQFGARVLYKILWRQFAFAYICSGLVYAVAGGKSLAFFAVIVIAGIMRLIISKSKCGKCNKDCMKCGVNK